MNTVVYPSVIARACSALDESPAFRDLPDGYFRVVVRIVKKINIARLSSPIVASRGTLAQESGKSIETVGRVVKWLEDRGLIQRTQKARVGLRGSSSPLVPTKALLDALLLTNAPARKPVDPASSPKEDIDQRAGGYPQELPVTPDGSKSRGQLLNSPSENSRGKPGGFVRIHGKTIPADLAWLVKQQDLSATGVLALMKLATAAKQRLSDVVALTRQYLERIRGRELYAYIKALISKDRDYRWIAERDAKSQVKKENERRLEEKAEALRGKQFQTKNGEIFVFVENSGMLTEIRNGRRCGRRIDLAFLEALDDGRLIPLRAPSSDFDDDEF